MHKYLARFPLPLWTLLCEAAKQNHRSVNQEIVYRLRSTFETYHKF